MIFNDVHIFTSDEYPDEMFDDTRANVIHIWIPRPNPHGQRAMIRTYRKYGAEFNLVIGKSLGFPCG